MKGTLRRILILITFCWAYFTYVITSAFFDWSPEVRIALGILLFLSVVWGVVTIVAQAIVALDAQQKSPNRTDDDDRY